jgi:hypothetical protein
VIAVVKADADNLARVRERRSQFHVRRANGRCAARGCRRGGDGVGSEDLSNGRREFWVCGHQIDDLIPFEHARQLPPFLAAKRNQFHELSAKRQ